MKSAVARCIRSCHVTWPVWLFLSGLSAAVLLTGCPSGCVKNPPSVGKPGEQKAQEQPAPPGSLEVIFTYGSEKEDWIKDVTQEFNNAKHPSTSGKPIFVRAIPKGSGECIDDILAGRQHAHLTSPASAAFIVLGNADSRAATGKELVGATQNLVLSPVVIAMWKPMAEAIGWGKKPVGWADILSLAKDPEGWATHGHGEWGKFKFGHTNPDYSNSGLISLLAEAYAGADKKRGLTRADVGDPKVAQYVAAIERSVVHYGSSTGFFGKKMFSNGPQYLSGAVMYESMVIESYDDTKYQKPFPVVAVYPKEGTFWSDHPVGIVEREWVTPEHRDAANSYIKFLLDRPQQEKAMVYGFRPADLQIPLAAPLDAAHGVNPKEPQTTLEVPSPEVMKDLLQVWRQNKKHSHITLVFDTSGSMQMENRLTNARVGALEMLSLLSDDDKVSFLPFDTVPKWSIKEGVLLKTDRENVKQRVQGLFAEGGTALYDAIDEAYQELQQHPDPDRIEAVVVLTDGEDTNSKLALPELLRRIQFDAEKRSVRIFTIGYSSDARKDVLQKIADATQAKFFAGTPENIREVFKEISTFF